MESSTVAYVLDSKDHIISVSEAWNKFADENDGVNLAAQDVCGRRIWDFVTGDATRMWLEALFQFARIRGTSLDRHYRCDSPDLKRFMFMHIDFEQGGILHISHEILATEQRTDPVYIKYGANTNNMKRCSICGRVNHGVWQEPLAEHADKFIGIIVIYTVCEECQRLMPGN